MLVCLSPKVRRRLAQVEAMRMLAEEWQERYEKALLRLAESGIEFKTNGDEIEFEERDECERQGDS